MSKKQLRRYYRETEKAALLEMEQSGKDSESDNKDSDSGGEGAFLSNRYEFLGECDEDGDGGSVEMKETDEEKRSEKELKKKKKKKKKKVRSMDTDDDWNIDVNVNVNVPEPPVPPPPVQNDIIFERDLFKIDSRMLDVENELRSILGRRTKDTNRRGRIVFGKIVKKKPGWPEIKNVGLSMDLEHTDGDISWFKFTHNIYYRELQHSFWMASESFDHDFISSILAQCPYHLDSLLVMAEWLRQQEDYQLSRDFIERGIFCCESIFAARFQLSNFNHRIDYNDFENRAFFLLLHRHLRNLVDRHCFKTALHVAKLIYRLDPVSDPLAIMLVIDTIALKAREYNYLIQLYNTLKARKNLNRLPNFVYSVALAHFLLFNETGNAENKMLADSMLASAIRHFPTVLLKILDAMNVQPDSTVEYNKYINPVAYERESEGIKLLTIMYVKMSSSVWLEDPSVLPWLEAITTATVSSFDDFKHEIAAWEELRRTCYVGIPRSIERHAYLWELTQNAVWVLTDPAPPYHGRMIYAREEIAAEPGSFFTAFLHSVWPDYGPTQQLNTRRFGQVLDLFVRIFIDGFATRTLRAINGSNQEGQNGANVNEIAEEEVESREVEQEHRVADADDENDDGNQADLSGTR